MTLVMVKQTQTEVNGWYDLLVRKKHSIKQNFIKKGFIIYFIYWYRDLVLDSSSSSIIWARMKWVQLNWSLKHLDFHCNKPSQVKFPFNTARILWYNEQSNSMISEIYDKLIFQIHFQTSNKQTKSNPLKIHLKSVKNPCSFEARHWDIIPNCLSYMRCVRWDLIPFRVKWYQIPIICPSI